MTLLPCRCSLRPMSWRGQSNSKLPPPELGGTEMARCLLACVGVLVFVCGHTNAQPGPPVITQVTDAATYAWPADGIAPQSLMTIFGKNLSSETVSGSFPLTTSLGGTKVGFEYLGTVVPDPALVMLPAPFPTRILYVSPSQINVLIPSVITDSFFIDSRSPRQQVR